MILSSVLLAESSEQPKATLSDRVSNYLDTCFEQIKKVTKDLLLTPSMIPLAQRRQSQPLANDLTHKREKIANEIAQLEFPHSQHLKIRYALALLILLLELAHCPPMLCSV